MEQDKFMEEEMDWRFFLLRFLNSIWKTVIAALLGAAICAGGHMLYRQAVPTAKQFQAETKLYIDFAEDSTGIGYGYYNDYTWKDLVKSDAVLLYAMELLPENITKETVEGAVEADIISDVRLLTITVTAADAELADSIAEALNLSLKHFPEEIKEIDGIRVIRQDTAKEIAADEKTGNRAIFGAVLGGLLSFFAFWLHFCMDAGIYLPGETEKQLGIPVLGIVYKKTSEKSKAADEKDNRAELTANVRAVLGDKKEIALIAGNHAVRELLKDILNNECNVSTFFMEEDFAALDYGSIKERDSVVLCIPYGANRKQWERLISVLQKQRCKISGVIIIDADDKLYRRYYLLH